MGQEQSRFDSLHGVIDEGGEFLSLRLSDCGAQVLNLDQALAYEDDLRYVFDSAHPGITDQLRIEGRDALWGHPDLLPTAEDLENPEAFVRGQDDLDISDLEEPGGPGDESGGADAPDNPGGPEA